MNDSLPLNKSLRLTLEIQERSTTGEPVPAEISLTNNTKSMIWFTAPPYQRVVEITIFDQRHEVVPLTKMGRMLVSTALKPGEGRVDSGALVKMESGTSRQWTVDLAECFELQPGTYEAVAAIRVNARDGDGDYVSFLAVVDDRVRFEIK